MTSKKTINGGLYLVLDPTRERTVLLEKLEQAVAGGVSIIQIWNHWPETFTLPDKKAFVDDVLSSVREKPVSVLIKEEWELLRTTVLDGVHFDQIPDRYSRIRSRIGREYLAGITCGNDLDVVRWADENGLDYISFCAMFPSSSAVNCEIVQPDTVRSARKITRLPLFVSGGLTPGNLTGLSDLEIDGVAVISGILNSANPGQAAGDYLRTLERMKTEL